MIEINPHIEQHLCLVEEMSGYEFSFDTQQVERARRKDGHTKDYAEYIF